MKYEVQLTLFVVRMNGWLELAPPSIVARFTHAPALAALRLPHTGAGGVQISPQKQSRSSSSRSSAGARRDGESEVASRDALWRAAA